MDATLLISELREALNDIHKSGKEEITIAAMLRYLDAVEPGVVAGDGALNRHHAALLAHSAAVNQNHLEMLRSVLEAGKSALQSLLVVNGGAVVAMLGVMANVVSKPEGFQFARYLSLPLLQFGIGVLLTVLGFGVRYLSQAAYTESGQIGDKWWQIAIGFHYAAIACAFGCYTVLAFAIVNSYQAARWTFGG